MLRILLLTVIILSSHLIVAQDIVLGQGNHQDIIVTTSSSSGTGHPDNTVNSQGFVPNLNAASRFMAQASFGGSFTEIESVAAQGFETWIDQQMAMAKTFNIVDTVEHYKLLKNAAESDPDGGAYNYYFDHAWWYYTMSQDDYLRQRIALALSEFFVISEFSSFGDNSYALGSYYDMLLEHAFSNYRDILEEVTFHPAMGEYLTYMNNPKSDTIYQLDWDVWPPDTLSTTYVYPDENYAREVMQLFSIGLCELDIDGTCQQDAQGVDIPTYDNVDIAEFAKIFTGLSYGDNTRFDRGPADYEQTWQMRMQMYDDYHEPGEKYLLNGFTVPDRSPVDGIADINDALDNIFNHQNVGPFLGKFLIQRLVTSNPSPGYVERVARAFNGEGQHGTVRGDMRAVIKAILLDEEARSCQMSEHIDYGMLREPFVRYVHYGRAFDASTPSGEHRNAMHDIYNQIQQKPMASPSVFNFFQSDYQPIGRIEQEQKVAPEFQITNTQTIAGYMNGLFEWVVRDRYVDLWGIHDYDTDDPYRPEMDLTEELALVDDARLPQLVERLNVLLAHGKLSDESAEIIVEALKEFEYEVVDCVAECDGAENEANCIMYCEQDIEDARQLRVRMAIYFIMSSPEYLINR